MEVTSSSHVVERVDQANVHSIAASIKPMFDNFPQSWSDCFISRVPERLRGVKPEAYTPLIVSIGPFHHGDARLKKMKYLKAQYLQSLLHRYPGIILDRYIEVLLKLETRARNCYAEAIPYTKEELVKMLVLDGCFLLELFCQYNDPTLRQDNDQLFENDWLLDAVHRDVLLLENQIPFFVLETLFNVLPRTGPHASTGLFPLIKVFLGQHQLLRHRDWHICPLKEEPLLLSVLVSTTAFESAREETTPERQTTIALHHPTSSLPFIPTANELSRVGITFKDSESSNLFDVRFDENGVLRIPYLVVDDRTESFLRNLIALEQTYSKTRIKAQIKSQSNKIPTISAYVTLMDCLVNTSTDVALLREQKVLHNQLGDDKEVAKLFNKLGTGIIMNPDEFYFSQVFKSVNDYYQTKWNEWRAIFIREFWSTPWKKTSLLAAIFLLVCTFVQTVCSILQVLPHWSK